MSDSDEEFASADEGEVEKPSTASTDKAVKQKEAPKKVTPESSNTRTKKSTVSKDGEKKQTTKQPSGASKNTGKPVEEPGGGQNQKAGAKKKQEKQKSGRGKGKVTTAASGDGKQEVKTPDMPAASGEGKQDVKTPDMSASEKTGPEGKLPDGSQGDSAKNVDSDQDFAKDTCKKDEQPADSDSAISEQSSESLRISENSENTSVPDKTVESSKEQGTTLLKSPSSQSITRPPPDHTDKQEEVLDRLSSSAAEKKGGWGWGWGSSLLEVASSSVSTFTKEVGEGLHTMLETVESTLNVPNPEELARGDESKPQQSLTESEKDETSGETESEAKPSTEQKEKPEQTQTVGLAEDKPLASGKTTESREDSEDQSSNSWFSSWGVGNISNISKMVESTSKNLVTSSLDVLETIGKKTFDAINEHDPGLKKTRGFLRDRGDKPNLSAVLREAKEQQEIRALQEKESEEARKAHFGSLFDDFQGLAHLEALEMLSNQCEKRVNTLLSALPPEAVSAIKPVLLQVKENFEIDEEEEEAEEQEFELLVTDLLSLLSVGTTADKLVKARAKIDSDLEEYVGTGDSKPDPKELHRIAISSLAELTSKCIEQFHKSGELILLQKLELSNFVNTSEILLRLTKVLTAEVGIMSNKFTSELNKHESEDEIKVNHLVTNIYLEATNSSSYVQDGFQLLLPVIQQAAIEKSQEPET